MLTLIQQFEIKWQNHVAEVSEIDSQLTSENPHYYSEKYRKFKYFCKTNNNTLIIRISAFFSNSISEYSKQLLLNASYAGDTKALYELGLTVRSEPLAIEALKRANRSKSYYLLGLMCLEKELIEDAKCYFHEAAVKGHILASYHFKKIHHELLKHRLAEKKLKEHDEMHDLIIGEENEFARKLVEMASQESKAADLLKYGFEGNEVYISFSDDPERCSETGSPPIDYLIAYNRNPTIPVMTIAFPGSRNGSRYDWYSVYGNWSFLPVQMGILPGEAHLGFFSHYLLKIRSKLFADILHILERETLALSQVIFTFSGYSRGGALANLAAADFKYNCEETPYYVGLVTVGSPRVFEDSNANVIENKINKRNIMRWSSEGDLVPGLPFESLGYRHVGTNYVEDLQQRTDVHSIIRINEALSNGRWRDKRITVKPSDHFLDNIVGLVAFPFQKGIQMSARGLGTFDFTGIRAQIDAVIPRHKLMMMRSPRYSDQAISQAFDILRQPESKLTLQYMKKLLNILIMSANQGRREAQAALGFCYHFGLNGLLEVNLSKAVKWYTKSSNLGSYNGSLYLGRCFEKGLGPLLKNQNEAQRFYTLAIKQGCDPSVAKLGYIEMNVNHLPVELLLRIFGYLSPVAIRNVRKTCKLWECITRDYMRSHFQTIGDFLSEQHQQLPIKIIDEKFWLSRNNLERESVAKQLDLDVSDAPLLDKNKTFRKLKRLIGADGEHNKGMLMLIPKGLNISKITKLCKTVQQKPLEINSVSFDIFDHDFTVEKSYWVFMSNRAHISTTYYQTISQKQNIVSSFGCQIPTILEYSLNCAIKNIFNDYDNPEHSVIGTIFSLLFGTVESVYMSSSFVVSDNLTNDSIWKGNRFNDKIRFDYVGSIDSNKDRKTGITTSYKF